MCPRFANPADFFMKVLSVQYPKKEADIKKIEFLKNAYDEKIAANLKSEHSFV